MEEVYKEEDFYMDGGWPSESYCYCSYIFYTGGKTEYGPDYDQFALVVNAEYPYIRLTKKRDRFHSPCGFSAQPATDGWFARLSDVERNEQCPKIVWGFAAVFIANLRYDEMQKDYVEQKDRNVVIKEYYNKYLKIYLDSHNGLKYSKITLEQKELDFLAKHEGVIRSLWEKCTPLKQYTLLYEYAAEAESDYEDFLKARKVEVQNKNVFASTSEVKSICISKAIQNGEKSVFIENNNGSVIIKE
jgi:hypothetical protein